MQCEDVFMRSPYNYEFVKEMIMQCEDVFMRSPYNYDRDLASAVDALVCPEVSLTRQEFAEETNINLMLAKFGISGELSVMPTDGLYGDFSAVGDYRSMLDLVQAADEAFYALPADVRRTFDNDPAAFCDFACDPANLQKLREWGLAPVPATTEPTVSTSELSTALHSQGGAL